MRWVGWVAASLFVLVAFACGDDAASSGDSPSGDGGPDGGGGQDGQSGGDSEPACTQALCGSACVDLQTSSAHCGACDRACKGGAACIKGRCGDEIVEVAAGGDFQCAVRLDGKVVCWGRSDHLALGVTPAANDPACQGSMKCLPPTIVPGAKDIVHVSAGLANVCAVDKDGALACWGQNTQGILGAPPAALTSSAAPVPIALPGGAKVAQVSVGSETACARTTTGDVYCWGFNNGGIAGLPVGTVSTPTPNKIALGGSDATLISVGYDGVGPEHACAIRNADTVWCWGSNAFGELGVASAPETCTNHRAGGGQTFECSTAPVRAGGASGPLTTAISVAAGPTASCAVRADGRVYCWGSNARGQLADVASTSTPDMVGDLFPSQMKRIVANRHFVVVQDGSGKAWAWGSNTYGEQGDGTRNGTACGAEGVCRAAATGIANLANTRLVSLGSRNGVALKTDGVVLSWGQNALDQAGHPPNTNGDIVCGAAGDYCNPTPTPVTLP